MGKDWKKQGFERSDEAKREAHKKSVGALDNHLKHRLWRLDEFQNFTDEVFTSVVNQATDAVSAIFIMRDAGTKHGGRFFQASMGVLAVNAVARLGIGLATVCSGEVRTKDGQGWKVGLGLLWGMIEPVSGNAILASAVSRNTSRCV